jgi:hypothetical protein
VGHCQLNKSLNVIGKHPTGKCDYCQETETMEHEGSIRGKERG